MKKLLQTIAHKTIIAVAIFMMAITYASSAHAVSICTSDGAFVDTNDINNYMDEKVYECSGSWEACCDECGDTFEALGLLSPGWDCDTIPSGVWLRGCGFMGSC
ncbi:MAG: hypothetical protein F6K10_30905 [Moorea sp. SIO2B7]|nr:hypothetical protein [Moorena sp. SIO2B7]